MTLRLSLMYMYPEGFDLQAADSMLHILKCRHVPFCGRRERAYHDGDCRVAEVEVRSHALFAASPQP